MKIFAIHDLRGNVSGVIACPLDGPAASMGLAPGLVMTEVEAPELNFEINDPQNRQRIDDFCKTYKVDVAKNTRGKLIQK